MLFPPFPDAIPTEWVSEDIIRQAFNAGQFWEQLQSGQLVAHIKRNSHADPAKSGEPYCTRSQYLVYYTPDSQPVAGVHQYLREDGTIGGSGRPDPKTLAVQGKLLKVRSKQ